MRPEKVLSYILSSKSFFFSYYGFNEGWISFVICIKKIIEDDTTLFDSKPLLAALAFSILINLNFNPVD